jgi:hypothetical protein
MEHYRTALHRDAVRLSVVNALERCFLDFPIA